MKRSRSDLAQEESLHCRHRWFADSLKRPVLARKLGVSVLTRSCFRNITDLAKVHRF